MDSYFLWDYTSDEIRALAPECVAIQPVASVEQHGPHLPLGTDSMIVEEFARRLRERFQKENCPALFLPLMAYGKSNEHINYPGTITYSAQTFMDVLMDVGRSCARAGFRKLVFLNAHGGNFEVLDVMAREIRIETGMYVFSIQPSRLPSDRTKMGCAMTPDELRYGIHGGLAETSAILHVRPELVKRENFRESYPTCFEGCGYVDFSGKVSFGWMTKDVSNTGAVGNPVGATAEQGEQWFDHLTAELYQAFVELRNLKRPGE